MSTNQQKDGQNKTISDIFLDQHLITQEQLQSAAKRASQRGISVEEILREEGFVTDELLEKAISEHYRVPSKEQQNLFGKHKFSSVVIPVLEKTMGKKNVDKLKTHIGNAISKHREKRLTRQLVLASRRRENRRLHSEQENRQLALRKMREEIKRRKLESRETAKRKRESTRHRRAEAMKQRQEEIQAKKDAVKKAKEQERAIKQEALNAKKDVGRKAKEQEHEKKKAEIQTKKEELKKAKEEKQEQKRLEVEEKRNERKAKRESASRARKEKLLRVREEKAREREAVRAQRSSMHLSRLEAREQKKDIVLARWKSKKREKIIARRSEKDAKRTTTEQRRQSRIETRKEKREQKAKSVLEQVNLWKSVAKGIVTWKNIREEGAVRKEERGRMQEELNKEREKFEIELKKQKSEIARMEIDHEKAIAELEVKGPVVEGKASGKASATPVVIQGKAGSADGVPQVVQIVGGQPAGTSMPASNDYEKIRKTVLDEAKAEFQVELLAQEQRFQSEKAELIKLAGAGTKGVAMPAVTAGPLASGTEEADMDLPPVGNIENIDQAKDALMKERRKFQAEKTFIKKQALAEAQAKVLSQMEEKGVMGTKQRSNLKREINRWKGESEKLEQEKVELAQKRSMQKKQTEMMEQKHKIQKEKIRLERERVARERRELEAKDRRKKELGEEQEKLEKEKSDYEERKIEKSAEEKEAEKVEKAERKEEKEAKGVKAEKEKNKKETAGKTKKDGDKKKPKTPIKHFGKAEEPSIDIGKILVSQNYVDESELETAKEKAESRHIPLEIALKEEGLVTKDLIQNAIAEYYKMPFVDLGSQPPDSEIVELLPEEVAVELRAISVKKDENNVLTVATSNPERAESILQHVKEIIHDVSDISVAYTSKEAIESALSFYRKPLNTRFSSIIAERKKIAPEIIEEIFADAIQLGASDIHFEPQEGGVIVRFRVDGVMHEAGRLPKEYYEGIVNRIKIAGNMRIDEHFAAQDGAIRWKSGDRAMDVRVSIVPVVDGEKIVMRLLSEYVRTLTLADLGFTGSQLDKLVSAAHKPFGMILTTGPTGSGKSTTLYGLMKIRNSPDVNISTIEDPVEYKIPGINHIQVNTKANLTFERGLRALVRQDPDIILVGEIRDNITAQISTNAALTGHLLFSTLHANDSATAVPRLLEMGIEPYILGSTLELIIAQRLMRRTCMNCRYSHSISGEEAQYMFESAERYFPADEDVMLYKGKGCSACGGTGFKGRVGLYELMAITPELEEAIVQRKTSGEILNLARSQGMLTLFEDGLQKVTSGMSTIEELMRVAAPPEEIVPVDLDLNSSPDDDLTTLQGE
jgi:type IV pilus assembly protein PilB